MIFLRRSLSIPSLPNKAYRIKTDTVYFFMLLHFPLPAYVLIHHSALPASQLNNLCYSQHHTMCTGCFHAKIGALAFSWRALRFFVSFMQKHSIFHLSATRLRRQRRVMSRVMRKKFAESGLNEVSWQ